MLNVKKINVNVIKYLMADVRTDRVF